MKLSPHILEGSSPDARQLAGHSPVMKLCNNWSDALFYANLPHRPLVIGRRVTEELSPGKHLEEDPIAFARNFHGFWDEKVQENPDVQGWEGWNEVKCSTQEEMTWYGQVEAERTRLLHAAGKIAVVGNFGTGQPEPELWPFFLAAFANIPQAWWILGLHEYGGKAAGWTTWNIGRFIKVPGNCPIIITEHGADDLPPEQGGTKPWTEEFLKEDGKPDIYAYANWLISLDLEYRKYSRILGVCIYTYGNGWLRHNVEGTGLTDLLIAYSRAEPVPPMPTSTPGGSVIYVDDWHMYTAKYHGTGTWASKYNPNHWTVDFDWDAVRRSNTAGVLLRVGIGYTKDPCFDRYLAGLIAIGMPWGIWHVYVEGLVPAIQAQLARKWCPTYPPLGIATDVEDGSGEADYTRLNSYLLELDRQFQLIAGFYSGGPYMNRRFTAAEQLTWLHRLQWWAGYPNFIRPAGFKNKPEKPELHQFTASAMTGGLPRPHDRSRLKTGLTLATFRRPLNPLEDIMPDVSDEDLKAIAANAADTQAIVNKYLKVPVPVPAPASLFKVRMLPNVTLNIRSGPAATFADIGNTGPEVEYDVWEVAANGWYRISQTGEQEWISGAAIYSTKLAAPVLALDTRGLRVDGFNFENTNVAVGEECWFNFVVVNKNPQGQPLVMVVLGAFADDGTVQTSFGNYTLSPDAVLTHRDRIKFTASGVKSVRLGVRWDNTGVFIPLTWPSTITVR